MKPVLAFILMALMAIDGFGGPAYAQTSQASERQAVTHFWRYANCVAKHDRRRAEDILIGADNSDENVRMTKLLATKNRGCIPAGSEIKFSGSLFRAALSGALLSRKYRSDAVGDYSSVEPLYRVTTLADGTSDAIVKAIALKQFSECVSRMAPAKTLALFGTKPYSNDEDAAFASLQAEMSHCLPVSEGQQFGFTRLELRTLLAEVAYELDMKLALGMEATETTEAQN